jgi:quinol monooxygenase YgiN
MFVVTVNLGIQADQVEQFRATVLQHAKNSLTKEEGCHRFDVSWDPADSTRVFIYEMYTDESAFQTHASSEHYQWFKDTAGPWIASLELRTWELANDE